MDSILISGPKSFFAKYLIEYFIEKKINFFLLVKNKKEYSVIKNKYKITGNQYILINDINKKKIKKERKFNIFINTITKYDNNKNTVEKIYESNVEVPTQLLISLNDKIDYFINIDSILDKNTNLYALTKFIFRKFVISFQDKLKLKYINIQFHNFYTCKSGDNNLISKIIDCSKKNKKIYLTEGLQKRDFIHINDAISSIGYIIKNKLKFKKNNFYNYNIGSGKSLTIKSIANIIRNFYNSDIKLNHHSVKYKNIHEKRSYFSKNSELTKIIKWKPNLHLTKILK
jgi:CDP-paratose synthetase